MKFIGKTITKNHIRFLLLTVISLTLWLTYSKKLFQNKDRRFSSFPNSDHDGFHSFLSNTPVVHDPLGFLLNQSVTDTDLSYIFKGNLSNSSTWEFDFSDISRRRLGRKYIELTPYDHDGRNSDFFNPVEAQGRMVVIFQDFGPGIIGRLQAFHEMVYKDDMDFISIEVDGSVLFTTSLIEKLPEKTYPIPGIFLRPTHPLNQGVNYFFSFPIAYKKSIRISIRWLKHRGVNGAEDWRLIKICKEKYSGCPIFNYFLVTCNKLDHNSQLKSTFSDYFPRDANNPKTRFLQRMTAVVSNMTGNPEIYGPSMRLGCKLTCRSVLPGAAVTIFSVNEPRIVQSLLLRVYDFKAGQPSISENWQKFLITMTWDDKESQVKEIPLSGLFTSGFGFLNDVRSLTAGMRKQKCDMDGYLASNMRKEDWLGYLFYEMPFWKSAKITVRLLNTFNQAILCSGVSSKSLDFHKYNPHLTGYFSAQLNQNVFKPPFNHKKMLHVENQWGHVVAINFFLHDENLPYIPENDIIIETDGASTPNVPGTGIEDFFHYNHDFFDHRNKTHPLFGVPFYVKKQPLRILRCYRHMIWDPILFNKEILIYLEGAYDRYREKIFRNFGKTSNEFDPKIVNNNLLTVAFYYGNKGSGGVVTDRVDHSDINTISSGIVNFNPSPVQTFTVQALFEDQEGDLLNRTVVSLKPGQRVSYTVKIHKQNVGVILKQVHRSVIPNQKARVKVDDKDCGIWFCPQRSLSDTFVLRLSDFHLSYRYTAKRESIKVTLEALTQWEIVSLEVMSVLLTL